MVRAAIYKPPGCLAKITIREELLSTLKPDPLICAASGVRHPSTGACRWIDLGSPMPSAGDGSGLDAELVVFRIAMTTWSG